MSSTLTEAPPASKASSASPEISVLVHVTDPHAKVHILVRSYTHVFEVLGRRGELVFILDGVGGDVLEQLERLQDERDDVRVFSLQGGGHGESIAYKAALEHARANILLTAWDYLQIDPRSIKGLLETLESQDADLVAPWRWPRIDPLLNRIQSRLFNLFLRWMSRVDLHDLNCNFRLMRREVLEEITLYGDLFRFLPIMAARRGFKVREVRVRHQEERGKTGFFGIGVYFRRLLDILAVTFLTRFTRKPLRFFGIIGLVLILAGLVFALPPFVERIFGRGGIQDRPIVLVGVVLISFGLQFIGFGLVGEIIIFTQSRNLKDYKIESVVSVSPDPVVAQEDEAPHVAAADLVRPAAGAQTSPVDAPDGVSIRRLAPGEDVVFDRFVEAHPSGTFFHLSSWRRMAESVLDRRGELIVAERDDEIIASLSWFHIKSWFLGRVAVSNPFAVYGGVIADDDAVARALLARAIESVDAHNDDYLELRQVEDLSADELGLVATDRYVTFVRDLPADPSECLGMIPRKARAECRRGIKDGLKLVEDVDLDLFHRLFSENKQSLGSPTIPRSMLEAIQDHCGERTRMHFVERSDGKRVAAVYSFVFRDRLLPYYSGVLSDHGAPGVNNFMYYKLMEWATEHGMKSFDFGRSRKESGPAHFKKNMGFEPSQLHYQYHLGKGGKVPDFTPDNPKLGVYKRTWQKLPASVARRLGGTMFKQLP